VVPVHRDLEVKLVPNPMVVTDRFIDELGRIVYGDSKQGAARDEGKKRLAGLKIDLAPLDAALDRLATKILNTFPDCTRKTLESLRKKKLQHWFANSETNRSWLALNMTTEASAGFPAFHFGEKPDR